MTNSMIERLTGSLWMVTRPGTNATALGRVYRDKMTALTHRDFDEVVVELRLAPPDEPKAFNPDTIPECPRCQVQHWPQCPDQMQEGDGANRTTDHAESLQRSAGATRARLSGSPGVDPLGECLPLKSSDG